MSKRSCDGGDWYESMCQTYTSAGLTLGRFQLIDWTKIWASQRIREVEIHLVIQEKQKQDPRVEKSLTHKNFVVSVFLFFLKQAQRQHF